MTMRNTRTSHPQIPVMVFGVGAFAQGVLSALADTGARVSTYLTRDYGHYGPSLLGPTYPSKRHPTPRLPLERERPQLVVPMSLEWALKPWTAELLARQIPLLSPTGQGLLLERDRDFARALCQQYGIPVATAFVAPTRTAARHHVRRAGKAWVIKNPLCSPFSPIHTIVCETLDDTLAWLEQVDDSEGIYLQEYLGRREAGHIALVSAGEIHSLITNQEYKRAFDGNLGIVAGAPLAGLVEQDPTDRYQLARQLLHPLLPWFRAVNFHGPVQVTAVFHARRWHVIEYNVRLGVTCGPLLLRMLKDPVRVLLDTALNRPLQPRFHQHRRFGCSLTLAGYGYPYVSIQGPRLPVEWTEPLPDEVWWGEVAPDRQGRLRMTGHRLADVGALASDLQTAIDRAYAGIRRLRCLGSYYRRDVGQSLWPPGEP